MNNFTVLTELLDKENVSELKKGIINIILDAVKNDVDEVQKMDYLVDINEVIDFIQECKEQAFDNVKNDLVKDFEKKIKESMEGE